MEFKITSTLFLIILISFATAQKDVLNETPTDGIDPTTVTPTVIPTTSPKPTTTTTTTTTTPKPTTTTATTTTTTTTTEPPPTPTTETPTTHEPPSPTPMPEPQVGKWVYTDKDNVTCILLQMAVQLNITYKTIAGGETSILYNIPVNQTEITYGLCNETLNKLRVEWGPVGSKSSFGIQVNRSDASFAINEMAFNIYTNEIPNAEAKSIMLPMKNIQLFETPLSMSYHCLKVENIKCDDNGTLTFTHFQLEAFHKSATNEFSTAKDCDTIDTPDIVPIAVGCALAALVIIVLVAYLIARRRSQARGYLSM